MALTVSSCSIAADGLTVTINIAGNSGALSPSTGVTGFYLQSAAPDGYLWSSAVVSGTSVILALLAPVATGDTVTLSYASGNLTDAGSNTLAGFSGTAVTNGSTQAVPTKAGMSANMLTLFEAYTGTDQGHNRVLALQPGLPVITQATGSRIDVQVSGVNAPIEFFWSIDGGATQNVTLPTGQFSWVTIFNGTDAPHECIVWAYGNEEFDSSYTFRCVGGAPAFSVPSRWVGNNYRPSLVNTYALVEGASSINTDFGGAYGVGGWQTVLGETTYSFYATCTGIAIWLQNTNVITRLSVDGVDQIGNDQASGATTGTYNYIRWDGLDGANKHLYRIYFSTANAQSYVANVMDLFIIGGSLYEGAPMPVHTPEYICWGDSLTQGNALIDDTHGNSLECWPHLIGEYTGALAVNLGYGGQTSTWAAANTDYVTNYSPVPSKVFLLWGANDLRVNSGASTLQSNYAAMMTALLAGMPNTTQFYCCLILPQGSVAASLCVTYNNAIRAAIASLTSLQQSQITIMDTTLFANIVNTYFSGGSLNSTAYTSAQLHLNALGNTYFASYLEGYVFPVAAGILSNGTVTYDSAPLTWAAATDGISPYTYTVSRSLYSNMSGAATLSTAQSGLTYTDNSVAASTTYYYQITAIDASSNTSLSNILAVTTSASFSATAINPFMNLNQDGTSSNIVDMSGG